MKIVLTGANGAMGKEFMRQFPETVPVSVRFEEYDEFTREIADADVLIHAGALVNSTDASRLMIDNALLTNHLLALVKEIRKDIHVVLISSMSVLGKDRLIKPPYSMSPYALSKFMMEAISDAPGIDLNISLITFSTLFYRDPNKDGLSKIINLAKTTGEISIVSNCWRSFLPINKACNMLGYIANNGKKFREYGKFVLGNDKPISLDLIGQYLQNKYDVKVELLPPNFSENVLYEFINPSLYNIPFEGVNIFNEIDNYYNSIGD